MHGNTYSERIQSFKKHYGKDLAILGHHYQSDEIIRHADIIGDSLELARKIPDIEARHIVFCGVYFMAESACLLANENQRIFIPDRTANCEMAEMAKAEDVEKVLRGLSSAGHVIPLAYVNSSLAVKAVVGRFGGAVCTSANAKKMMEWAMEKGDKVLFLPDRNLGRNVAAQLGISENSMLCLDKELTLLSSDSAKSARLILWPGYCPIHQQYMKRDSIFQFRNDYPGCRILLHPECDPNLIALSDGSGSTSYLIKEAESAANNPSETALCIGTEYNLVQRLAKNYEGKLIIVPLSDAVCPDMGKITEKNLCETLEGLDSGKCEVCVREDLKAPARASLIRMLENCK